MDIFELLEYINQFGRGEAPTKREERSDDLFESEARNRRRFAPTSLGRSEKPEARGADEFGAKRETGGAKHRRVWGEARNRRREAPTSLGRSEKPEARGADEFRSRSYLLTRT